MGGVDSVDSVDSVDAIDAVDANMLKRRALPKGQPNGRLLRKHILKTEST